LQQAQTLQAGARSIKTEEDQYLLEGRTHYD
jgi:hypothetical protein